MIVAKMVTVLPRVGWRGQDAGQQDDPRTCASKE